MIPQAPVGYEQLSLAEATRVDAACDRFEQAWKAAQGHGETPRIPPYLDGAAEPERTVLARELVAVDVACRQRYGLPVHSEEYEGLAGTENLLLAETEHFEEQPVRSEPEFGNWPRLPGFELLEVVGTGGMGIVYRARQTALGRDVAVKMLHEAYVRGTEQRERFKQEALALARLEHSNLVQVHDSGDVPRPYLVLEYVPGGSLADRLRGQPQPAHEAAALLETLARAVHYAHGKGIIHRDLKPANILLAIPDPQAAVGPDGGISSARWNTDGGLVNAVPKITDFGLARLEASAHLTQTGDILGSPSYMAPEQLRSKSAVITPATDVYGLGAILYECLTGRPPFLAETMLATLDQVRDDDPVPPRRLWPTLPRDLETICLKCLEKEPAQRYPSAAALADDLRRFREGTSILARPAGTGERVVKWARRRPAVAALMGGIVAVALLGLLGILWQFQQTLAALKLQEEAHQIAETRRRDAEAANQVAEAGQRAAKARSHFDRIARAYQAHWWLSGERTEQLLAECKKESPDLCLWEWEYLDRLCRDELITLEKLSDEVQRVVYSRDGRYLATCTGRWNDQNPGEVQVWDATEGKLLHTFSSHKQAVYTVAFHPGGRFLASAGRGGTLRVWDLKPTHAESYSLDLGTPVHSLLFSHDGEKIFAACADGHVRVVDHAARRVEREFLAHTKDVYGLALSPDGGRLATAGFDGQVRVWDLERGGEPRSFPHHLQVRRVAFSPDGRILASGAAQGTVNLWDLERPTTAPLTLALNKGPISDLVFYPDGRFLAVAPEDGSVRILDVRGGRETRSQHGHGGQVTSLGFSPDGRRLATGRRDRRVKIWDLTAPGEPHSFFGHVGMVAGLAVSSDGKLLAVASGRDWSRRDVGLRTAWVMRSTDGGQRVELIGHQDWLTCVAFRPDGRQVASGSEDRTARLWNPRSGRCEQVLKGHGDQVTSLAYDLTGKLLLTASADKSLRLWDIATGQVVHEFLGHTDKVLAAAFSADGRHIVSGGADRTVRIWESATGRPMAVFLGHAKPITAVACSPQEDVVASADADQVRLWELTTGRERTAERPINLGPTSPERQEDRAVGAAPRNTRLAFSRDGRRLATASPLRPIQLWDVATGWEALAMPSPPHYFLNICFSPAEDDGRLFAAVMDTVIVWDAKLQDRASKRADAVRPERLTRWHEERIGMAERGGNLSAALFHANQGLEVRPDHALLLAQRGATYAALGQEQKAMADLNRARKLAPKGSLVWSWQGRAHVALGQWKQAVAAYERAVRADAKNPWHWYNHATALLGHGRGEEYRAACAAMLKRFGQDSRHGVAGNVVYALASLAKIPDQAQYLEMVERAIPQVGGHERAWALVYYRTGRYREAIDTFEKAHGPFTPRAWDCLFLAMAHRQLQQFEQARAYLDLAVQWIDRAEQASADLLNDGPRWFDWRERVEVQAIRREAEMLMGVPRSWPPIWPLGRP